MEHRVNYPTRFDNLLDLARLPWFEAKDGRLVLADKALGPAMDVHTHLALAYALPNSVDLLRLWPQTEHYLAAARPLDLDVYINRNFTPDDLKRLEVDLALKSVGPHGMRRTHSLPNLAREMDELGVLKSVLLPIDYPVFSQNAMTWLQAAHGHSPTIGFGCIHPYRPGMRHSLQAQIALGAKGIKFHPAVQMVRPDDRRAMKLYRLCAEFNLVLLFHCGPVDIETRLGRYLSQVRHYERALAENPDVPFILGHSGALQMAEALEYTKKYPNVYVECSSQSVSNCKTIFETVPRDKILFGSDWPFYHQAIGLAKVFMATDGDAELRKDVLWRNGARLFGLPLDAVAA